MDAPAPRPSEEKKPEGTPPSLRRNPEAVHLDPLPGLVLPPEPPGTKAHASVQPPIAKAPSLMPHTALSPTAFAPVSAKPAPPPPASKSVPPHRAAFDPRAKKPSSAGAIVAIIVIVLMILVGAFYAWGKRIDEQNQYRYAPAASPDSLSE